MATRDLTFAEVGIDIPAGRSGDVKTGCPRCQHTRRNRRDRSLSVNVDRGEWNCHHCGWQSGLGKETLERTGERPESWLSDTAPIRARREQPTWSAPAADYVPRPPEHDELGEGAARWFAERGIDADTVKRYGITSGTDPRRGNVIHFPYRDLDGAFVNAKHRTVPDKSFWQDRGSGKYLYGLPDLIEHEGTDVIVVEGEMDKLALAVAGEFRAVSVPDGAPGPNQRAAGKLAAFAEERTAAYFDTVERVYVAVDMDEPGEALAAALIDHFGVDRCHRVRWPDGCKDANDTLLAHGIDGVVAAIETAEPVPVEGVVHVHELVEDVLDLWTNGLEPGLATGMEPLDNPAGYDRPLLAPKRGHFHLLTGVPGSGKSAWLDNLMVNMSALHGWRWAVCSPENHPIKRHMLQLLAVANDRPYMAGTNMAERLGDRELPAIRHGLAWLNDHFAFIAPEEPSVDDILAHAQRMVNARGLDALVIDPWSELEQNRPPGKSETEHIGGTIRTLRRWGRRNNVAVFVVAHPTKLKKEDGAYPVVTPYDISGSAHWFNMSDTVLSVWRNHGDPAAPVELHVQKVRWAETGCLGVAEFAFDRRTHRYRAFDGDRVDGTGTNNVTGIDVADFLGLPLPAAAPTIRPAAPMPTEGEVGHGVTGGG